jgi:hypothetical protein
MMKLPGIASAGSGLIGEIGGAASTGIKGLPGGAGGAHAKQENSDLSKVVEDLLHDKLMDKMGGGAASSPFGGQQAPKLGGLQLPKFEGGHGPVVHGGGQSALQGAKQENGDLMKVLEDLLKQRSGGAQAQPQAAGGLGGENDDLMKLLMDLLKGRSQGSQGAAASPFGAQGLGGQQQAGGLGGQQQLGGLAGQNEDLMKLIEDLLKDKSSASGVGDSADAGSNPMHLLQQQGEQLKGLQAMMQQTA